MSPIWAQDLYLFFPIVYSLLGHGLRTQNEKFFYSEEIGGGGKKGGGENLLFEKQECRLNFLSFLESFEI